MDDELLTFSHNILPEPSIEQQKIIKAIKTKNVMVNAVAGSGKTTTVCLIGQNQPSKKILLLTYNKRLKFETQKRVKNNDIENIKVHNYHSFCFNHYLISGNTDQMIIDALDKYKPGHKMTTVTFNFDMIIIDEAQDLTELYVRLIKLIISHNKKKPKMCIIGDSKQTIYSFNGADKRFLEFGNEIFNINDLPWTQLSLSISYRMSPHMANFLNKCVLKEDVIVPGRKTGVKPRYIFCNAFGESPVKELTMHYLQKFDYTFNDIFILAPSIQSDLSPVKMFANNLSTNHNIPIFIPTSDNEKLDSNLIQNKIVFASFHQVKGLERKCVIIFGFDNSYYYYYNNDGNKSVCPNEIYVGLSRCSERMTIIHHYRKNFIDFIDNKLISQYCYTERISTVDIDIRLFEENDIDISKRIFEPVQDTNRAIDIIMDNYNFNDSLNKPVKLSVTKLISHLPINIVNTALSMIDIRNVKNICYKDSKTNPFDSDDSDECPNYITENIKNDSFLISYTVSNIITEDVSEIVGTGIPIYYEYIKNKKIPIMKHIEQNLKSKPFQTNAVYRNIHQRFTRIKNLTKLCGADIFELVTIHLALTNNYVHKINQLTNYNFMKVNALKKCVKRLDNHINSRAEFEIYRETDFQMMLDGHDVPVKRTINGFIDCIDSQTIWEFKTVQNIQRIHMLQLAIYAFLFHSNMEIGKTFKLLNINDGDKYELFGTVTQFKQIVEYIYSYKFTKVIPLTDEEFKARYIKN